MDEMTLHQLADFLKSQPDATLKIESAAYDHDTRSTYVTVKDALGVEGHASLKITADLQI